GVCSKAPHCPVALHGNTMGASAYRSHPSEIAHCNGRAAIRVGPVAKLTIVVPSQSHHRPIHLDSQCLVLTRRYGNCVGHPDRLHRHIASSVRPIAQLTVVIVSPIPNCPVSLQSNSMSLACPNRHRVINRSRPHRNRTIGSVPSAKLPVIIVSPRPDRAVRL